ncbi:hypothetical protein GCM10010271_17910 [Streptomyces kurssanovii]|nr:hypothetical protein GCM10010271_17910 [Streptomyces kurssanovii]
MVVSSAGQLQCLPVVALGEPVDSFVHGHVTGQITVVGGGRQHRLPYALRAVCLEIGGDGVDEERRSHGPRVAASEHVVDLADSLGHGDDGVDFTLSDAHPRIAPVSFEPADEVGESWDQCCYGVETGAAEYRSAGWVHVHAPQFDQSRHRIRVRQREIGHGCEPQVLGRHRPRQPLRERLHDDRLHSLAWCGPGQPVAYGEVVVPQHQSQLGADLVDGVCHLAVGPARLGDQGGQGAVRCAVAHEVAFPEIQDFQHPAAYGQYPPAVPVG